MIYVGIDPGLSGAVAAIKGEELVIFDTPVLKVGKKREMNTKEATAILKSLLGCGHLVISQASGGNEDWSTPNPPQIVCVLERVHAMPKQGVTSVWSFGKNYGQWLGILAALEISHELVTPQAWKRVMMDGMPKEKDASIQRVHQLFPEADVTLRKHHGRADALLMAEYIRRVRSGKE
jgi:hypothetical protein